VSPAEWLGYVASVLVATSLVTTSILRLRVLNLAGAVVFVVYSVWIRAWPVAAVNLAIVFINLYRLRQIARAREYFRLFEVRPSSEYLAEFLAFHAADVRRFFPGFTGALPVPPTDLVFFVLRDMVPAGLFIGEVRGDGTLHVHLDYVTPSYRDFKVAAFVFGDNADVFRRRGVAVVVSPPGAPAHEAYLRKMGFERRERDGESVYVLPVT
jgi:hypothetical protein